jgi:hypothetical protein
MGYETMAANEITWETVLPVQFRFDEPGTVLEGVLVSRDFQPGIDDNERGQYIFEIDERLVILFGSTILDRGLRGADVGVLYRITYTGDEVTSRGYKVKIFSIEREAPGDK